MATYIGIAVKCKSISGNEILYPVNKIYQIDKEKMINNYKKSFKTVDFSNETQIL